MSRLRSPGRGPRSDCRRSRCVAAVILATVLAAGTGMAGAGGAPVPNVIHLTVGSTTNSSSAISFVYHTVLKEMPQFYQQVGLEVDGISVQMGQAVQLVASGSPPVVEGSGQTSVAVGFMHGVANVKIFAGSLQKPAYELVARPGIGQLTQIKTLGVPSVESASSQVCQAILRSAHMEVNKDYSLVLLGTSGARVAAVQAGKVDGSCELLPFPELYRDRNGLVILAKASTYLPEYAAGAWIYNTQWARDPVHHAALVRLAEAILLASRWAMDSAHKSPVVALVAKTLNVPAEYAELFYAAEIGQQLMTPDGYIPMRAALGNAADMVNMGLVKTPPDPSKYYDWSILQEAAKALAMPIRRPEY